MGCGEEVHPVTHKKRTDKKRKKLVIKLWIPAIQELETASQYKGGDDRRSLLNKLICYKRSGNILRAAELVDILSSSTERAVDFALFGWVSAGQRRFDYYARALNVAHLIKSEFTVEAASRLAKMCNDDYLGLEFKADDFIQD